MSIHIDSEDYITGSRTDGTWNFNKSLKGTYKVVSQTLEVQTMPWIWTGITNLYLQQDFFVKEFDIILPEDLATYSYSSDKTAIATYFQTRFNYIGGNTPGLDFSCTWTYDSSTELFNVVFNNSVKFWWNFSSCAGVFGINAILTPGQHGTEFNLNAKYINISPRYLYCYISEVSTTYNCSNGLYPNLIFSAYDNELVNQTIHIPNLINTLTISVYLPNISNSVVPLSASWELILTPK